MFAPKQIRLQFQQNGIWRYLLYGLKKFWLPSAAISIFPYRGRSRKTNEQPAPIPLLLLPGLIDEDVLVLKCLRRDCRPSGPAHESPPNLEEVGRFGWRGSVEGKGEVGGGSSPSPGLMQRKQQVAHLRRAINGDRCTMRPSRATTRTDGNQVSLR
jgi:hypothetical protein